MATAVGSAPQDAAVEVEPDGLWEFIDGRYVEKPLGVYEVWLANELNSAIKSFLDVNRLGRVVIEMTFLVEPKAKLQRRPDVAFVSRERWPLDRKVPRRASWDVIPDLAVEVVSPSNTWGEMTRKLFHYFAAGVRLVWIVDPDLAQVYVYESLKSIRILDRADILEGGVVLPGFRLALADYFEDEPETPAAEGS